MSERGPRQSLLLPLVIPLGSLAAIALVLFGFSRILLNTTHAAATVVALVAAAGILAIAAFVAARSRGGSVALLSMVGGAAGVALLAGGVALVAAPPHEGDAGGAPVVAIVAPPNAAVDGFAQDTYTVPADVAFEIEFDNQDPGATHNVEIAVEEGGETLYEGEIVTGPVVTTYPIEEPLAEGEYFFFCVVHPTTMTGTLQALPGGGEGGGGEGGGGEGEGGGGGAGGVTVVAQELAFDPTEISLPADTPSTITFDDRDDAGTFGPHNIAIYEDEAYTSALFTGDLVNGPATVEYEVPALPAGTFPFRCDVHPQMTGTVTVDGGG
jgi:plastocyanin